MATLAPLGGAAKAPWHLWAVGIGSLLWNSFGCYDYVMSKLDPVTYLKQMSLGDDAVAYVAGFPAWLTVFWALGVWGSLAGSLLLLARSRHAVTAFAVSLVGLVVSQGYQYAGAMPAGMKTGTMMAMSAVVAAVLVGFIWYALRMRRSGVLR